VKKKNAIICMAIGTICLCLLIYSWVHQSPVSMGDVAKSPDGKYEAFAFNVGLQSFMERKESYVELKVNNLTTRQTEWQIIYRPKSLPGDPNYTMRGVPSGVRWSPDSASVSFRIAQNQWITFPVRP
jgi:hypothetical protein